MAKRFKLSPTTDVSGYFTAAMVAAVDADCGKPVKLISTDTYQLCASGDPIDAYLEAVEPATEGGKIIVTLNKNRLVRAVSGEIMAVGDLVKAGANAASGTTNVGNYAIVLKHTTAAVGEVLWRVVSGNTTDTAIESGDATVILERV